MGKRVTIGLAVVALLAVLLGAYCAGYFWLGKPVEWRTGANILATVERVYPYSWAPVLFSPAAKVEGWVRGINVRTHYAS